MSDSYRLSQFGWTLHDQARTLDRAIHDLSRPDRERAFLDGYAAALRDVAAQVNAHADLIAAETTLAKAPGSDTVPDVPDRWHLVYADESNPVVDDPF